jgi:hypothetical protein
MSLCGTNSPITIQAPAATTQTHMSLCGTNLPITFQAPAATTQTRRTGVPIPTSDGIRMLRRLS